MNDAPERIWLQLGAGDHGSHTSCEDYQGWDEGGTNEPEYVRADIAAAAKERAVRAALEAAAARVEELEIELRISIGGCDANFGNSHSPISVDNGKYTFCQLCGETMTKAEVRRHSSAAAVRYVKGAQDE
jgi:hypothetical protein